MLVSWHTLDWQRDSEGKEEDRYTYTNTIDVVCSRTTRFRCVTVRVCVSSPNMISKEYRLSENEVRKVLNKKKPFFSYVWIANTFTNKGTHGRCGILLSSKCTKWSVNRNFWRRRFYDLSLPSLTSLPVDVVLVAKKWTILDYRNPLHLVEFEKNIQFLYKKIREGYGK